jgi:hypothetical protein
VHDPNGTQPRPRPRRCADSQDADTSRRPVDPDRPPLSSRRCPCHDRPLRGGPAQVWCAASGRFWQADDPQLWCPPVVGTAGAPAAAPTAGPAAVVRAVPAGVVEPGSVVRVDLRPAA